MPAVWTSPPVWSASTPIDYNTLNQLIGQNGDLDWLKARVPTVGSTYRTTAGNYSSNSATFVDLDAANCIVTLTTASTGNVICWATLNADNTTNAAVFYDWILDSTTRAGSTNGSSGIQAAYSGGSGYQVAVLARFTGLSLASHTFKIQWRTAANTAVTVGLIGIQMVVMEI